MIENLKDMIKEYVRQYNECMFEDTQVGIEWKIYTLSDVCRNVFSKELFIVYGEPKEKEYGPVGQIAYWKLYDYDIAE